MQQYLFTQISILFAGVISSEVCPRPDVGDSVTQHENLFSIVGYLDVHATYESRVDDINNTLFCYTNYDDVQSPTLRVYPGETILFTLLNNVPGSPLDTKLDAYCSSFTLTSSSTNIHFHGLHSPPDCHVEDAIHTILNFQETYTYDLEIPVSQPPGLYWYHHHVHSISEGALFGGASGAIVIEGIENFQPLVQGLPEQIFVIRDVATAENVESVLGPHADISVNYVPINYPDYTAANLIVKPKQKQFWRVVNAAADTILELQVQYDYIAQPLTVVALDGVVTGANQNIKSYTKTSLIVSPGGRVEFIVTTPSLSISSAKLMTLNVDTGADGDRDPLRPIFNIIADTDAPEPEVTMPMATGGKSGNRVETDLLKAIPVATRKLVFSEIPDPDGADHTVFFITVDGATPEKFHPNVAPAIHSKQGTVEDWIIENHALEDHVFHIHQLHFLLLEENGKKASNEQLQYLDSVQVKYWDGVSAIYPSVKIRMDFTGDIAGKFPFHCHILEHEDKGMMAMLEVTSDDAIVKSDSSISLQSQMYYSVGGVASLLIASVLVAWGLVLLRSKIDGTEQLNLKL